MKRYAISVAGHVYEEEASDIRPAIGRALGRALFERGTQIRDGARGPVGLDITVWERRT